MTFLKRLKASTFTFFLTGGSSFEVKAHKVTINWEKETGRVVGYHIDGPVRVFPIYVDPTQIIGVVEKEGWFV